MNDLVGDYKAGKLKVDEVSHEHSPPADTPAVLTPIAVHHPSSNAC